MKWAAVLLFVALAIDGLPALDLGHGPGTSSGPGNKKISKSGLGVDVSKNEGVKLTETKTQEEKSREYNQQNRHARTTAQNQDGSSRTQSESEKSRSENIKRDRREEQAQSVSLGGKNGLVHGHQTSESSENENRDTIEYNKDSFSSQNQNGGNTRNVKAADESGSQHQTQHSSNEESSKSFGLNKHGLRSSESGSRSSRSSDFNQAFDRNQQSEEETSYSDGYTARRKNLSGSDEQSEESRQSSSQTSYNIQGQRSRGSGNQGLLNNGGNQDADQNNYKIGRHHSPIIGHWNHISHKPSQGNFESHLYNQNNNYGTENRNYGSHPVNYDRRFGNHYGRFVNGVWNQGQNNEKLLRGGHQRNNYFVGGTGFQGANPAEYLNQNPAIEISRLFSGNGYQTSDVNDGFRRGLHQGRNQADFITESQGSDGRYISRSQGNEYDANEDFSEFLNQGQKVHFVSGSDDQVTNSGDYVSGIRSDGTGYQSPDLSNDFSEVLSQGPNKPQFISGIEYQGINSGNYLYGVSPKNRYSSNPNDYSNRLLKYVRGALHPGNTNHRNYINEGYVQEGPSNTGQYRIQDESEDVNSQYISKILTQAPRLFKHGAGPKEYGITSARQHTSHIKGGGPVYGVPNQGISFYDTATDSYMDNHSSSTDDDDDDDYGKVAPGYIVPAVILPETYPNGRGYRPNSYYKISSTDGSKPTTIFGRDRVPVRKIPESNDKTGLLIDRTLTYAPLAPPLEILTPLIPVTPSDNDNEGTSGDASAARDIIIDRDLLSKYDTTYRSDETAKKDGTAIDKDLRSGITHGIRHPGVDRENIKNVLRSNHGSSLDGNNVSSSTENDKSTENNVSSSTENDKSTENTTVRYTDKDGKDKNKNDKTDKNIKKGLVKDDRSDNKDTNKTIKNTKPIVTEKTKEIRNIAIDGKAKGTKDETIEEINKGLRKDHESDTIETITTEIKNVSGTNNKSGFADNKDDKTTDNYGIAAVKKSDEKQKNIEYTENTFETNDKSESTDNNDGNTSKLDFERSKNDKTIEKSKKGSEMNDKSKPIENNYDGTTKTGEITVIKKTVSVLTKDNRPDGIDKAVQKNSKSFGLEKYVGSNSSDNDDATKNGEPVVTKKTILEKITEKPEKDKKGNTVDKTKKFLGTDDNSVFTDSGNDGNIKPSKSIVDKGTQIKKTGGSDVIDKDDDDTTKNDELTILKKYLVKEKSNSYGNDDKETIKINKSRIIKKTTVIKKDDGSNVDDDDKSFINGKSVAINKTTVVNNTYKDGNENDTKAKVGKDNGSNVNGNDDDGTIKSIEVEKAAVIQTIYKEASSREIPSSEIKKNTKHDNISGIEERDEDDTINNKTYKISKSKNTKIAVSEDDTKHKTVKKNKGNKNDVQFNEDCDEDSDDDGDDNDDDDGDDNDNDDGDDNADDDGDDNDDVDGKDAKSVINGGKIDKTVKKIIKDLKQKRQKTNHGTDSAAYSNSENGPISEDGKLTTDKIPLSDKSDQDQNSDGRKDEPKNYDDVNDLSEKARKRSRKSEKIGAHKHTIPIKISKDLRRQGNKVDLKKAFDEDKFAVIYKKKVSYVNGQDKIDGSQSDNDMSEEECEYDDDDTDVNYEKNNTDKPGKLMQTENRNGSGNVDRDEIDNDKLGQSRITSDIEDIVNDDDDDDEDDNGGKPVKRIRPAKPGSKKVVSPKDEDGSSKKDVETGNSDNGKHANGGDKKYEITTVTDTVVGQIGQTNFDKTGQYDFGHKDRSKNVDKSSEENCDDDDYDENDLFEESLNATLSSNEDRNQDNDISRSGKGSETPRNDDKKYSDSSDEDCDDDEETTYRNKTYKKERVSKNGDVSGIENRNENEYGKRGERIGDIDITSIVQKNNKESANSGTDVIFKNDKSSYVGKASQDKIKEDEDRKDLWNYDDDKSKENDNDSSDENYDSDDNSDEHAQSDLFVEVNKSGSNGSKKSGNDDGFNNVNRKDNGDGNSESSKDSKSARNGDKINKLDTEIGTILREKKDNGSNSANGSDKNDHDGKNNSKKGDFVNSAESRNDEDNTKGKKDKKIEGTTSEVFSNENRHDNGENAKSGRKEHKTRRKEQKYDSGKEPEYSVNNGSSVGGKSTRDRRSKNGNLDVIGKTWRARNYRFKVGSKRVTRAKKDLEYRSDDGENRANGESTNLLKTKVFRDHKHKTAALIANTLQTKEQKNDDKSAYGNVSKKVGTENIKSTKEESSRDANTDKTSTEKDLASGSKNNSAEDTDGRDNESKDGSKYGTDTTSIVRASQQRKDNGDSDDGIDKLTTKINDSTKISTKKVIEKISNNGSGDYNGSAQSSKSNTKNDTPTKSETDKSNDAKQQKYTTSGTVNDDVVNKKSPITVYTNAGTNQWKDNASKIKNPEKRPKTTTDPSSEKTTGFENGHGKGQDNNGAENCDGETRTSKSNEISSQLNEETKEANASSTVNRNNEKLDRESKEDKNSNGNIRRTEDSSQSSSGDGSSSAVENLRKEKGKTYYEKKLEDNYHFKQQEASISKEEKKDSKGETVLSGKSSASKLADQSSSKKYTEESDGTGNKKSKKESSSSDDKKNQASSSRESKTIDPNGNTKESKSSSTKTDKVSSNQHSFTVNESRRKSV